MCVCGEKASPHIEGETTGVNGTEEGAGRCEPKDATRSSSKSWTNRHPINLNESHRTTGRKRRPGGWKDVCVSLVVKPDID